ncbi:capsular polysaccharide transport system permease protein [Shimia aestuarii]|uniref:Capsular polysaccharide transport system permease protein n=2 Tax=Shimia aestuarii TaxID=254406 RepID=A0A1I4TII8_9RHOB|nr:capsular polysaccharide transport system permease protein [Shimia aestuarii]
MAKPVETDKKAMIKQGGSDKKPGPQQQAGQKPAGAQGGAKPPPGKKPGGGTPPHGNQAAGNPAPHQPKRQPSPPGQRPSPPPKAPPVKVVEIRPKAPPAQMKRRHWGLIASFVTIVLMPVLVAGWYLYFVSVDQYASAAGFTVRKEEAGSATDLMGGLAQFAGVGSSGDADVLYEFIQSQEIVEKIDVTLDLRGTFSAYWDADPVFALWPDASIEDLVWYWSRIVLVSYDQSTGLINLQVRAFSPEMAQRIGQEIVRESQIRVNELNAAARADMMGYAQADLADAIERLKSAREELTEFRVRTRIVDPVADIQGRMGVLNTLQQQLAQTLIDYDILRESSSPGDPRIVQELRRIEVIRARIEDERESFAVAKVVGGEADYPTLLAEFEGLTVDREFAEETYRAALAAFDIARDNASRQSRYLATYIRPTIAESAEYPKREIILGLVVLFLLMGWSIMALVYYSLRDRR